MGIQMSGISALFRFYPSRFFEDFETEVRSIYRDLLNHSAKKKFILGKIGVFFHDVIYLIKQIRLVTLDHGNSLIS